jgi:tryptophan synthase alpha subunit
VPRRLSLISACVFNRLQNEDQVAAVIADGIAASLQPMQLRIAVGLGWSDVGEVAAFGAVGVAGVVVKHEILRQLEDQRGRVALRPAGRRRLRSLAGPRGVAAS